MWFVLVVSLTESKLHWILVILGLKMMVVQSFKRGSLLLNLKYPVIRHLYSLEFDAFGLR